MATAKVGFPLARVRLEGVRVVRRLRKDAKAFVARSRTEMRKEVRGLERRVARALHAASEDRVARLERRVAKLENALAELRRPAA